MILVYNGDFNVVRRCFTYWMEWDGRDWCDVWPWGEGINIYSADNNIVENSIGYGPVPYRSISIIANAPHVTAIGNQILGSIAVQAGMNEDGTVFDWGTVRPGPTTCDTYRDFTWPGQRSGIQLFGSGVIHDTIIRDVFSWGNAALGFNDLTQNGQNNILDHATIIGNGIDNPLGPYPGRRGGPDTDALQIELDKLTVTNSYIEDIFIDWPNFPDGPRNMTSMNGEGARLYNRYVDGVLTTEPLWPWPMEDRIQDELGFSISNKMTALLDLNGYLLSTNQDSITLSAGGSADFTVSIDPTGTFTETVQVSVSGGLSGELTFAPQTTQVTPPHNLVINVSDTYSGSSDAARFYTITITSDGDGIVKTEKVAVIVWGQETSFFSVVLSP